MSELKNVTGISINEGTQKLTVVHNGGTTDFDCTDEHKLVFIYKDRPRQWDLDITKASIVGNKLIIKIAKNSGILSFQTPFEYGNVWYYPAALIGEDDIRDGYTGGGPNFLQVGMINPISIQFANNSIILKKD